jgi:hypothetical protein
MSQIVFPRDDNGAVYTGGNATHINSNTSVLVKQGVGYLHRVTVGKTGSADWNLTLYDGIDDTGSVIGVLGCSQEGSYEFAIQFKQGLYVVAAGTTPGDITISSI